MTGALTIDNFAGGGGASLGMEQALGQPVSIAVNHDENAILMHRANHPATRHYCENVWEVDPLVACGGRPVEIAWFSPDCKDFSKAKGGKPISRRVRGLAWVVLRWAAKVRPTVIFLENVEEFEGWGPLTRSGRRCKRRQGLTFERWVSQLRDLGYEVDWHQLRACDYGAPTIRKRLFIVARCDGRPIRWPEPTHGAAGDLMGLAPYRTAAECMDWSIPCTSIFGRQRPLAEATMRRIARGVMRYVIEASEPFIIRTDMQSAAARNGVHCIHEPVRTITTGGGMALVTPFLSRQFGRGVGRRVDGPAPTITAGGMGKTALVAPTLVQTGYGEREGQAPRSLDLHKPLGTVVAGGNKHALVAAFLAKHFGGMTGVGIDTPLPTTTARATQNQPVVEPLHTVQAGGLHYGEVRAFLIKYFGAGGQHQDLFTPLHTATTKARFGLVTVEVAGEPYVIADIGMRMLTPRELFRAQGFPDTYDIECVKDGKALTKTAQVEKCGNSVAPQVVRALVAANAPSALPAALKRGLEAQAPLKKGSTNS